MSADLMVEEWPAAHARLVEQMRAVRPGLSEPQAHAALQALRTLRWVLHPSDVVCAQETAAAICGASGEGFYGPVVCSRPPHADDQWHRDTGGTLFREIDAREGS